MSVFGTLLVKADLNQEIQSIKDKGELVVAMFNQDEPPFFMKGEDGELIGFDVEIAKEIARRLKVKLRFDRSASTYDDVIDMVSQGKADIGISKLSYTPRRGLKVLFTKPYFTLYKAAFVNRVSVARAGEVSIKELLKTSKKEKSETRVGKSSKPAIGVRKGSAYVRYAKVTFPDCEVVELESWTELIEKVKNGELTVVFSDSNTIKQLVFQNPNLAIDVIPVILKSADYLYMAYSNKNPFLAHWIDLDIANDERFSINYDLLVEKYKEEMKRGS